MRISDRYLGKQVLLATIYAVIVLSLVLVLGNLFKEIRPLLVNQVADLGLVARFVLNVLPFSLMFTIPWGFLTAVLLVFGRLSAGHEITAFRVAGISLARLALPVFVIGAVLSGVCLYLNVNVVPQAKASLGDLLFEQAKRDPRSLLDPGKVQAWLKGRQKIFVESREGDALLGFHLYQLAEKGKAEDDMVKAYVHAGRVTLVVDEANKQLRLKLSDAYIETEKRDGTVEMAFAGAVEPYNLTFDSKDKRRVRATSMTNQEISQYLEENPQIQESKKVEYRAEITKRISFSMACMAFAMIAVPLGLHGRRKDTSTGLVVSLILGAGYFLFSVFASEFESDLGAAAVLWLPNVLCVLIGLFLFRRARFR